MDLDQVVVGNGSCELILLGGQALLDPGTTGIHADPSFASYPHLARAAGAEAMFPPAASCRAVTVPTPRPSAATA